MSKLFKHEPLPQDLSLEFLNEFYDKHEKMTYEEVVDAKAKIQDTLINIEVNLTKDLRDVILKFIESKDRIKVYGVGEWKKTSEFVKIIRDTKSKTLKIEDIVVLRTIIHDSKLTTIDAIESVGTPIVDALEPINLELSNLDQLIGMLAEIEARKDREAKTGLEYAEGDSDNLKVTKGLKQ